MSGQPSPPLVGPHRPYGGPAWSLDSANAYGSSQVNTEKRSAGCTSRLLTPGYNRALREGLCIATKTGRRYVLNPAVTGATAIDDLKRSLTQMFGDGRGAYLEAIQMHNLTSLDQVNQIGS